MKIAAVLAALIGLAACSATEELAACKGPAFALNTGHWQPTPDDLEMPKIGRPE